MKTLNVELFKPGLIFQFKGNKHIVLKDNLTDALVVNLEYDNCKCLEDLWDGDTSDKINQISYVIDTLSYGDILEDIINQSEPDLYLLIDQEYDDTISIDNN